MRKWHLTLSDHDKKILLAASLFGGLILLIIAWQFLSHATTTLMEQTTQERSLLAWMQAADLRLQQAEKISPHAAKGTLPTTLQAALTAAGLTPHIAELRQNENGSVQLSLTKVDFDALARLLGQLQKEQGVSVLQIHVTRISDTGSVNATMVLQ